MTVMEGAALPTPSPAEPPRGRVGGTARAPRDNKAGENAAGVGFKSVYCRVPTSQQKLVDPSPH